MSTKRQILVIDDEDDLVEVFKLTFKDDGYELLSAADGEEGLKVFEQHWKEIAIVILDIGLPKLQGSDVFKRMKSIDPNVKVIVISGSIDPTLKFNLFAAGVKRVIIKPFKPYELLVHVHELMLNI